MFDKIYIVISIAFIFYILYLMGQIDIALTKDDKEKSKELIGTLGILFIFYILIDLLFS